ncbi:glycosyltransferase [Mesorhizobium sp.]|uniref:glycosyltransferase n=1 Tax=Mesorhizobium sp. TaxID=1871066 RepID=UPI00257AE02D|nr:glycosyltransferase [Mesorhizobium sp.]
MANYPKPVGLIMPHVGRGGGAGIYINDVIQEVSCCANLHVAGDYRLEYASSGPMSFGHLNNIKLYIPNYRGVSRLAKLYWLVTSFLHACALMLSRRKIISDLNLVDFVIVTSSIQAFVPAFLHIIGYRGRTICIVQENLDLSGALGSCIQWALKRASVVIAISASWQQEAIGFNLDTVLLENRFSCPTQDPAKEEFDIAYVGGESPLKGFPEMLRACAQIAEHRKLRIAMLGRYSQKSSRAVQDLQEEFRSSGLEIVEVGLTSDVYLYLKSSKVLVLPIREGHFLRPAIEAGLCCRTFVVAKHTGIEDFAFDNVNCLMYEPGDLEGMVRCIEKVIDDSHERTRLAEANYTLSVRFLDNENWGSRLRRIVVGI